MTGGILWLQSHSIQSLLNLLVDRLDSAEARGTTKPQSVALTEKTWPALYEASMESEKETLWAQLMQMHRWGWLQVKPEAALRSSSGYASSPKVIVLNIEAVRKEVGRPERVKSSIERWRESIERHLEASAAIKKAAGDYCIDIPDRSMDEVVQRLNGLQALAGSNMLLREVSARLFWGMSKILDNRQPLIALILESEECPFPESPVQLQVYLPNGGFREVLFIENQMTFEQAARSSSDVFIRLALVYASGFKGSALRLRNRESVSIYYSHRGALGGDLKDAFESWLFAPRAEMPAYFWGDLDWSGMRILAAMRGTFPTLEAWQPGYEPMLDKLKNGQGHSPEAADKRGQRPITSTGCSFADERLLPELVTQRQFVDQEMLAL